MNLSYTFIYDRNVQIAMDKLLRTEFDARTTYNIRKIQAKLDQEFKKMKREVEAIVNECAEKDENNKLLAPNGPGSYKIKEDLKKKYEDSLTAVMNKKFEIEKVHPLTVESLSMTALKLSAFDMQALEPLFEDIELNLEKE